MSRFVSENGEKRDSPATSSAPAEMGGLHGLLRLCPTFCLTAICALHIMERSPGLHRPQLLRFMKIRSRPGDTGPSDHHRPKTPAGFEPAYPALQTGALPLGHGVNFGIGAEGLEPP